MANPIQVYARLAIFSALAFLWSMMALTQSHQHGAQ